jgi:hypothetical protein
MTSVLRREDEDTDRYRGRAMGQLKEEVPISHDLLTP